MQSIHNLNYDYLRAVRMLEKSINTPMDLVRFWSLSCPFLEDQPEIEKIIKKDWQWLDKSANVWVYFFSPVLFKSLTTFKDLR